MTAVLRGSLWTVVGAFALVGPFVGGLVFGVMVLIESPLGPPDFRDFLSLPLAGLMGYPFGALPAVLTGAVSGVISGRVRSKMLWVSIATASGWGFAAIVFGGDAGAWRLFGPIGAVSAFVSALVALGLRPRWSN